MGPINYGALQTQLDLSGLQRGLELRSANRLRQSEGARAEEIKELAKKKFDYDQAEDAEYRTAVEDYILDGTPEKLRNIGLRFPGHGDRVRQASESYTGSQQQDMIQAGWSAISALAVGKPEVATQVLQDRVKALRGAKINSSHTQAAIDMIKAGEGTKASNYLSFVMAGLTGPDHAAQVLDALGVGAKAENAQRRLDNEDRRLDIADRRANAAIAQGNARVDLSRQAGARADRKARQGRQRGRAKLPSGFVLDGYSNAQLDSMLK